jgi:hypothetical protein
MFKEKFDKMILAFDDRTLEEVMKHVGRLGNIGIIFGGVVGLIKYRATILPFCPWLSVVIGIFGLVITFFLLVAIGIGGWKAIRSAISNRIFGHLGGATFFLFTLFLGLGGIFVAANL